MVLICNNNILTIEQFHKNRCVEKKELKDILIEIKHNKENFKETPYIQKDKNETFLNSNNSNTTKTINSINIKCPKNIR